MQSRNTTIFGVLFMLLIFSVASADTPKTLSYQGKLSNSIGDPVGDSTYSVQFDIYTDPLGGEGYVSLWSETNDVSTSNGLFSVILGTINPIPDSAFIKTSRFLVISLDGEVIIPATKLTAVPYASHAHNADSLGAESADFYLDWDNQTNVPSGFADGVDNEGSSAWGDLTGVPSGFADGIDDTGSSAWGDLTGVPSGFADGIDDEGGASSGIASHQAFLLTTLNSSTMTDISTVTITIPAAGYIYVTGRCTLGFKGTIQDNIATVQIDETPGGSSNNSALTVGLSGYANVVEDYFPVTVDKVFHKTSAGTFTFRLEGIGGSFGDPSGGICNAYYQGITAMYFPVAMGTVD